VIFLRFFGTQWKIGKIYSNIYFSIWAIKGHLMVSTLSVRKIFLDTPGAQGSHPKTGPSNIGKTHFYP
jgi:hypothetical protein